MFPFRLHFAFLILTVVLSGCAAPGGGGGRTALPADLTRERWFPPVTRQQGVSCSQQAGLYYLFTAEWNRTHRQSAASPATRFSPYFTYAMLAGDATGRSHVVDGWIAAQQTGVPVEADCPVLSRNLMHGYERYLRALRCKVEKWDVLTVTSVSDVNCVKSLIAAGHPVACDFQIKGTVLKPLPSGSPHAGEKFVQQWGRTGPGHAMLYAGFDDRVGFDFNGDGVLTNDRDITGDGRVTLADCERGAFLVINPWGGGWGDFGRAWVPWRHHATASWPWSHSVAKVEIAPPYQPRLMLKLRLRATNRQNVRITAGTLDHRGIATGRTLQPWMFSHAPTAAPASGNLWDTLTTLRSPGPHLSMGSLAAPGGGPLETGHDLTPLGTAPGYTLEIRAAGRGALAGDLAGASFMEYDGGGRLVREVPVRGLPVALPPAGGVWRTSSERGPAVSAGSSNEHAAETAATHSSR